MMLLEVSGSRKSDTAIEYNISFYTKNNFLFYGISSLFADLNIILLSSREDFYGLDNISTILIIDFSTFTDAKENFPFDIFLKKNISKIIWLNHNRIHGSFPVPSICNEFIILKQDLSLFQGSMGNAINHSFRKQWIPQFSHDEIIFLFEFLNGRSPEKYSKFISKSDKYFYRIRASISKKLMFRNAIHCFFIISKHKESLLNNWLTMILKNTKSQIIRKLNKQ